MALQESPEKYVIRTNLVEVTRAVTENLDRVSDRLVEKGFMTVNAAIGIKGTLGTTTSSKASEFMQQVLSKTHNEKREEWFEKFVGILGNDTAEQELVQKLIRDYVERKPDGKGKSRLLQYSQALGKRDDVLPGNATPSELRYRCVRFLSASLFSIPVHVWTVIGVLVFVVVAMLCMQSNSGLYYHMWTCYSQSLPYVDNFVGREEDIKNITGYLDFTSSDIQVVHIVGPPGFGKSTLAKKVGGIFLQKGVSVHYVDMTTVTDMDNFAEKVMLDIIGSPKYKITLDRLVHWVQKQYSNTLLILDNCDEMFETQKEGFLKVIKILSSKKSVRYLLTSQKWVADVGNFRLHAIYNLSSVAASQLLGKVAPGLTDDQKMQIAELTGNVPLALEVVGAIFKFPNAPTAEEVIQGLRDNPVITLSPSELHSKVDVSIGLAYNYLSPQLKKLCVNLSHFPGSFDQVSAVMIFNLDLDFEPHRIFNRREPQLDMLVRRSLLQYNHPTKRYHFHRLIRNYIRDQEKEFSESLRHNFESGFQLYFASHLSRIFSRVRDYQKLALDMLDADKHNFQYMFTLFQTAEHTNSTFVAVKVTLYAIQANLLQMRFSHLELCNISQKMLVAMESYAANEETSQELFEVYTHVLILAAKLERRLHRDAESTVEMLASRKSKVDDVYRIDLISMNTYIEFYTDLAQYYKEQEEETKSSMCHAHILSTVHNQLDHCYPHCNYFSISIAYEKVGNREMAFQFRELTYKHQLSSLNFMSQIKLHLALYNDYSSGNNVSKADGFSTIIIEKAYYYLIAANMSEYLEEVYYDAVDFFRAKNMEEHMINIQLRMKFAIQTQCLSSPDNITICLLMSSLNAIQRKCYHLSLRLGELAFRKLSMMEKLYPVITAYGTTAFGANIVGQSYYHLGNYSHSQIWLKRALQHVNQVLKDDYSLEWRGQRADVCFYLILSGDYFNVLCYGYFIKDQMSKLSAEIVEHASKPYRQPPATEKVILSKETDVTEEKYSFVWSQFGKVLHKFQCAVENKVAETMRFLEYYDNVIAACALLFILVLPYVVSITCIITTANLMSACTEQQIVCCLSCATLCIFLGIIGTIVIFLFVLCLDWLF